MVIERFVSMPSRKSTFGAKAQQLDRLLSLGLDTSDDEHESERTTCPEVFREQLGAQLGRYRLLRILGEGGMAVVYLADQREPPA